MVKAQQSWPACTILCIYKKQLPQPLCCDQEGSGVRFFREMLGNQDGFFSYKDKY